MNKPVDTIAFWNKRIEDAEAAGKIGYSVFVTDILKYIIIKNINFTFRYYGLAYGKFKRYYRSLI